ncbi:hypothetical protein HUW62_42935 [Myxococcus sp. AM011]|uniref:hypothetical protein n=1 Tax=Myxococcus sp. AM011 TaxID=2745200 RepID=UPI001594F112|nr:hypothetical protein [Myxococcus sp. AM011]NVJ27983.1 hypothetical protein [Myxococcus sp. AM011]
MKPLVWSGSFQISELLAQCMNDAQPWPPAWRGVYLVSRNAWTGSPNSECHPLYVGSNTGKSQRFCTRIGDLIADLHGFYDGGTGHHSGGQTLWKWCRDNKVHPGALYLGWGTSEDFCARCAEVTTVVKFVSSWAERAPLLNGNRPPACRAHGCYVGD